MVERFILGFATSPESDYFAAAICDTFTHSIYPFPTLEDAEDALPLMGQRHGFQPGIRLRFVTIEQATQ